MVHDLDAGQRAMLMHRLRHQGQRGDVQVAPQPPFVVRRAIAGGVDFHFFGADHAPATLGFYPAQFGEPARLGPAHAVAVGNLEEAVLGDDRADALRLEEDVVTGITGHAGLLRPGERAAVSCCCRSVALTHKPLCSLLAHH
ncbi:hypothetical protein D3C78_1261650 [compost metagenome]